MAPHRSRNVIRASQVTLLVDRRFFAQATAGSAAQHSRIVSAVIALLHAFCFDAKSQMVGIKERHRLSEEFDDVIVFRDR